MSALGAWLFGAAGGLALVGALAVFLAGAALALWQLHRHHPHARLGVANAVTLLRLALVSTLLVPLLGGTPAPVAIIALAIITLSLDASTAISPAASSCPPSSGLVSTWKSTLPSPSCWQRSRS